MIAGRKQLISDLQDFVVGKARSDFLQHYATDDIEFEDFLMRWTGKEEFALLLNSASRVIKGIGNVEFFSVYLCVIV